MFVIRVDPSSGELLDLLIERIARQVYGAGDSPDQACRNGRIRREAAREVLRYAFETLALEQMTAEAAARNFASLRILAKLGFKNIESFVDESDEERCERFALDGDIGSSLLTSNAMPDC